MIDWEKIMGVPVRSLVSLSEWGYASGDLTSLECENKYKIDDNAYIYVAGYLGEDDLDLSEYLVTAHMWACADQLACIVDPNEYDLQASEVACDPPDIFKEIRGTFDYTELLLKKGVSQLAKSNTRVLFFKGYPKIAFNYIAINGRFHLYAIFVDHGG